MPPLKIRLMPFSTKFPSNSKAYIAFSISIGSAFVLLCLFVIHFLSKRKLDQRNLFDFFLKTLIVAMMSVPVNGG